ncbi:fasciclin domain-containing protein [Lysobacter sp. TY2-98]|nr:fasciclin domain-containing protein [Lysobacter sp. TY2-98]
MNYRILSLALIAALPLAACSRPAAEDAAAPAATTADTAVPAEPTAPMPASAETAADAMPMQNPMVGGAPMYAEKDIVDNAVNSKDHTTLVAAVKAAGLVDTLKGAGPFTVFAPTNAAFDKLPKGTVDTLLKPDKKADLTKVLTYHVVSGKLDAAALKQQIAAGNGSATLKTVQGETLTAKDDGAGGIVLTDAKGGQSHVTIADVMQKNGVIHVVDTVLMP